MQHLAENKILFSKLILGYVQIQNNATNCMSLKKMHTSLLLHKGKTKSDKIIIKENMIN